MITSIQNPRVKWVRSIQKNSRTRRDKQVFVVEGVRLAEEALDSGWEAHLVLYNGDLNPRGKRLLAKFLEQGAPAEEVSPQVMQAVSDTEAPQGLLAVLASRHFSMPERLDFVFVPDAVRDPGNLGTMLRTASAAGVQAVFLPPGTVDPFAPKVVRAGMGAHFRLPIFCLAWQEIACHLESVKVYLAAAGAGRAYTEADFRQPLALVIGGEAEGAGPQAQRLATEAINIPMPGGGESLNAAAAAAVLLFEVVRQRGELRK
jgi:TrmH family RNA methyltransferase